LRIVIRLAVCIWLIRANESPLRAQRGSTETQRLSSPTAQIDDAYVPDPGTFSIGMDFGYSNVGVGDDFSFPGGSVSLGLTNRVAFVGSAGYVRSRYEDIRVNGAGDAYAGLKFRITEESGGVPGIAVKPMMEVLGEPSIHNNPLAPDRVNAVFPVAVEKSFEQFRTYYTTGYYTRGIVFHTLALEMNRWSFLTPYAIIWHGRLTKDTDFVSELQLNVSRSDVLFGVGFPIKPGWSAYGNVSRTIGRTDPNSSDYQISSGFQISTKLWGE
jgi:hypothetical protein